MNSNIKIAYIVLCHKNAGQIILRWIYQEGVISLPKSTNEERMKGNIDIFDFELTDEEIGFKKL